MIRRDSGTSLTSTFTLVKDDIYNNQLTYIILKI
jgi:hypothetical protein